MPRSHTFFTGINTHVPNIADIHQLNANDIIPHAIFHFAYNKLLDRRRRQKQQDKKKVIPKPKSRQYVITSASKAAWENKNKKRKSTKTNNKTTIFQYKIFTIQPSHKN